MEDKIETVRLIYRKKDNITAVFLTEFFRFIGCITCNYLVHGYEDNKSELLHKYEVNILLGDVDESLLGDGSVESLERDTKCLFLKDLPEWKGAVQDVLYKKLKAFLKNDVIKQIWDEEESRTALLEIVDPYVEHGIFYYWYNKENLKIIRGYYSLFGKEKDFVELKREAWEDTFEKIALCYLDIAEKQYQAYSQNIYFQYVLLDLQYKINQLNSLMDKKPLFRTETLLKEMNRFLKEYSDSIRMEYLAASVCEMDARFLWEAEIYYMHCLSKLQDRKDVREDFLYYQIGRYYENIQKDLEKGIKFYDRAWEQNHRSYRSGYKCLLYLKSKKRYREALNRANYIIRNLMNGYEMKQLMPKEQIYLFKIFIFMGDCYSELDQYSQLAILSYERAIRLAETTSVFFEELADLYGGIYKGIARACMETQPVYLKMTNCFMKNNEITKAKECYIKMMD